LGKDTRFVYTCGKKTNEGLKICEDKWFGHQIVNLTKYSVETYDVIEQIMREGHKNQMIATNGVNRI
jgi:hypothetical protein